YCCGKPFHDVRDLEVRGADDLHGSSIPNNLPHLLFDLQAVSDDSNHDGRLCMRRHHVRSFTSMKSPYVECTFSQDRIITPIRAFAVLQHGKEVSDGEDPALRISGVPGASRNTQIDH